MLCNPLFMRVADTLQRVIQRIMESSRIDECCITQKQRICIPAPAAAVDLRQSIPKDVHNRMLILLAVYSCMKIFPKRQVTSALNGLIA